jgi:hypothetical protein
MFVGRGPAGVYSRQAWLGQKGAVQRSALPEGLVQNDSNSVAQIEAPDRTKGRNCPDVLAVLKERRGQANGLATKDEGVSAFKGSFEVGFRSRSRKQMNPAA